jgi:Domain of unknown function (DUF4167)
MPNDKQSNAARRGARNNKQRPRPGQQRPNANRPNGVSANDAKRSYDRYMALARDAASAGDSIESENFYQHAEHYLRTMREQVDHRNGGGADPFGNDASVS